MSDLLTTQQRFALLVGRFLTELPALGYSVTLDEAYRPPETADLYARQGRGLRNSVHCNKLAVDLNLFRNGTLCQTDADFKPAVDLWLSYAPDCRAGANFSRKDYRHFSLQWQGRM